MSAPDSIKRLVETFDRNIDFYKSQQYNEAQLRQEFLDPFFKELGWDMENESGLAPQYRDVIHEASIRIGRSTKAPDYAFSIHGDYKFFLEAKKPSVDIQHGISPAYQLRRYGWSAKLPVSILSDFEEFSIYDCRTRPKKTDKASNSRVEYIEYTDYIDKWEFFTEAISKRAILQGSFDDYITVAKTKKGTETVDEAFLSEIEKWRVSLARGFSAENPYLDARDLNFAVQKTIDRIVFLRICEDRGIEDYESLHSLTNQRDIYPQLLEIFEQADRRYNSGLFHFSDEDGRSPPDKLTKSLSLDDKTIKAIISNLYYPDSPYEFSVLPADILGNVYEQFLGKTIHLSEAGNASVEEKPEVRKAGGVYYTPNYIVENIVENTIGPLLNPSPEKPISIKKASELRILDASCGSGSFLIAAYQFLLDWHLVRYTVDSQTGELDPTKIKRYSGGKRPSIYKDSGGDWKLSTDERKRVLTNNIFGVDIDAQAVEVTKLSLLLKVIEGETSEINQRDWVNLQERILPDLGHNILCGNSLVGADFYNQEKMPFINEETEQKVNVFDWNSSFPRIFAAGGFDCVIGNPPYLNVTDSNLLPYFKSTYQTCEGRVDMFELFIEKAAALTKNKGYFGYIVPAPLLTNQYSRKVRTLLGKENTLQRVQTFSFPVFSDPTVHTCIFICQKTPAKNSSKTLVYAGLETPTELSKPETFSAITSDLLFGDNNVINVFITPSIRSLLDRLSENSANLGDICYMRQCIKTGDDKKYLSLAEEELAAPWVKALQGRGMDRYSIREKNLWLKYGDWLARNWQNKDFYERPKIGIRETGARLIATLDLEERYFLSSLYSVYFRDDTQREGLHYLLGILNSKFASWLAAIFALNATKGAFTKFRTNQLAPLPIRLIDFNDPQDSSLHTKIEQHVEKLLHLYRKQGTEKNPNSRNNIETQVAALEANVDKFVYELYGLCPEEIARVENFYSYQ